MAITLILDPQIYMVGDRPLVEGKIIDQNGVFLGLNDLIFSTLRGTNDSNSTLLVESKTENLPGSFKFQFVDVLNRHQFGNLWSRAFFKEAIIATLTSGIDSVVTTANITVSTGSIPNKGWIVIENEACTFTKLTDTSITIARGKFESKAASHASGVTVGFSISAETCINPQQIEIETEERELFRFQNIRFRGE